MSTDSYLEHFVLLLGWILNNKIWDILVSTGIFALPLVFKLLSIWLKVREEGDDEGNKGVLSLPRMERAIYLAFLVILFCVMPTQQINLNTMRFDKNRSQQCGTHVLMPQESGYRALISDFDGKVARVPLWWYFVHSISKGLTRAAIAEIPCGEQFRQLRFQIQHKSIKDPILQEEVQEFADQCYARAYYRLKATNTTLSQNTIAMVGWIGSPYFLTTPGYYDYYTSSKPRSQWFYDPKRDNGYPDVGRGGYPSCAIWWSAANIGLKDRVLANYHPVLVRTAKKRFGQNSEEVLLRWLVSPKNMVLSAEGESYRMGPNEYSVGLGNNLKRFVASIGTSTKQLTLLPAVDALKQALPIVQALIEMIVIIIIPLLLMFSAYDPKTVFTITFATFAIYFVSFWWELAGWIDDRLISIVHDSLNRVGEGSYIPFTDFINSSADGWIMTIIMASMYVLIPMVWFGSLSWSGISIGAAFSTMLNKASTGVQAAGEQGSKVALKVAQKAASMAAKKK